MEQDSGDAVAERLSEMWTAVLGGRPSSPEANFFVDGGNSLLAMKFMARVRKVYGSRLRLREIFDHPTISAMTARLTELTNDDVPPGQDSDALAAARGEQR